MIPNKSNFKFQELTPITGVKPYVIRFWETEFPEISPTSSTEGEKLYSRSDVETILKIKKFLFEDKLSIPEAKAKMSSEAVVTEFHPPHVESSETTREDLLKPKIKEALDFIQDIKFRRNW